MAFQHGFASRIEWYTGILTYLASYGFVVFAGQMYDPDKILDGVISSAEEAVLAAQLYDWLTPRVAARTGVQVDATAFGIAGHSRGGKVSWTILKGDPTRAKAVAGSTRSTGPAARKGARRGS